MNERRNRERIEARTPCSLELEGRSVAALLENLSDEGALIRIEPPAVVSNDDLGFEASFTLRTVTPARRYTGEVLRLYFKEGNAYLALRFWQKYSEIR